MAEHAAGRPEFNATRNRERQQLLEDVGKKLRNMMPFLDPVDVDKLEGTTAGTR
jgi:ketol-acid reductoisomerase